PVDPHVQLNTIVDGEVALALQLEATQAIERHQQGLKSRGVFIDVGLTQPLHCRVNTSNLGGICWVYPVGLGAGEPSGTHETHKSPEKECAQEWPMVKGHARASIARPGGDNRSLLT